MTILKALAIILVGIFTIRWCLMQFVKSWFKFSRKIHGLADFEQISCWQHEDFDREQEYALRCYNAATTENQKRRWSMYKLWLLDVACRNKVTPRREIVDTPHFVKASPEEIPVQHPHK